MANSPVFSRITRSDYVKIVPILALAFYISFIPHISYTLPIHVDEWVHMAYSRAMMQSGAVTFTGPFAGAGAVSPFSNLETSFQLFWGVFQSVTGIAWIDIFRYFPSIVFVFTVLAVYVMARRQGFGWEAALICALTPTTVGILGPAFLVPVALGLLFIPLSLFVAFNFRAWWSYLVLFAFAAFLVAIHAPSAIVLVILLFPYIILNLKSSFKHSLGITLALAVPFLVPFSWIFRLLAPTWESLFSPVQTAEYIQLPRLIPTLGYFAVALCFVGVIALIIKRDNRNYALALGLLLLLLMLAVFHTLHRGVPIVYERGLMFAMLAIGMVAGAGLAGIRTLRIPDSLGARVLPLTRNAGAFACLALIGLTLATTIPARQTTPYYSMIDQQDYQAFEWIEKNVKESGKAILEPWKATAFTAVTLKSVYSRIHAAPQPADMEAMEFLRNGANDTAFLKKNGITIVYSPMPLSNPDLVEVREGVYLLKGR